MAATPPTPYSAWVISGKLLIGDAFTSDGQACATIRGADIGAVICFSDNDTGFEEAKSLVGGTNVSAELSRKDEDMAAAAKRAAEHIKAGRPVFVYDGEAAAVLACLVLGLLQAKGSSAEAITHVQAAWRSRLVRSGGVNPASKRSVEQIERLFK